MTDEPETIEGEVIEVHEPAPTSALVPAKPAAIGIFELGAMDDAEYQRQVEVIQKGQERIKALMRDLLQPGRDYMDFASKGSKDQRVGLLKPGAEALATFFRLIPTFRHRTEVITFEDGRPDRIDVDVMAEAHYGSADGPVVGAGSGASSSWEVKYHYRQGERLCPTCEQPTIIKGRAEYGGGWVCFKKKGGCGAKFADADPAIVGQDAGKVENPDPHELRNTLLKMATKRAWTDTVIRALNASALFTQDVEDMVHGATPVGAADGGYGGDDPWGEMNDPRAVPSGSPASAPTPAAGARNAPRTNDAPAHAHAKGEEWQDGDPGRFEAKLEEAPDGTRSTDQGVPVLEIKTKVGTSVHRIYLEGPAAQWAFLILGNAPKGTEIVVDATRYLFQWDDTGKPPMKRLRKVTRIGIRLPGGKWQAYPAASGPAQAPGPKEEEASTPPAGDPGTSTTSASSEGAVAEAAAVFEPQRATGEAGTKVDAQGSIYDITWETYPRTQQRFVLVQLLSDDDGLAYRFAYGGGLEDQLLTADKRGFKYHPSDMLRCTGTWTASTLIVGQMAMRV